MGVLMNIAEVIGEKIPTSKRQLTSLVRKAKKKSRTVDEWQEFSEDAQAYLESAMNALREKQEIPIPEDFDESEEDFSSPDEKETEEFEPLPEFFECSSQQKNYPIENLLAMHYRDSLRIPSFQRKYMWSDVFKHSFLRVLFTDIPIPTVMLAVDKETNARYVLDGVQRLTTIRNFKEGKEHLGPGDFFHNKKFSQLSKESKDKFLTRDLNVVEVTCEKKYWGYIFRQINRGGAALNAMEIRRGIYSGLPMFGVIEAVSESEMNWLNLYGNNRRYKGMQTLLRATAMHHRYQHYQKPMEQFLDAFCDLIPTIPDLDAENIDKFHFNISQIGIALWQEIGKKAFRLAAGKPVNAGLIDCLLHAGLLSLAVNPNMDTEILGKKLSIIRDALLDDEVVRNSLTQNTSGREEVVTRMKAAGDLAS